MFAGLLSSFRFERAIAINESLLGIANLNRILGGSSRVLFNSLIARPF